MPTGLTHMWEVRTRYGWPVDTSALAEHVQVLEGGTTLKLVNVRDAAKGLKLYCVLMNETAPSGEVPAADANVLLPPGQRAIGSSIEFVVEEADPAKKPRTNIMRDLEPSKSL